MESLLSQVVTLSKKKDFDGVHLTLERGHEILVKSPAQHVDRAIDMLIDGADAFTLGLVWIASMRVTGNDDHAARLAYRVFEALAVKGDYSQIHGNRKAMGMFRVITHAFTDIMRQAGKFRKGTSLLFEALRAFRPSDDYLTPAHSDIMLLYLKADNPKAALNLAKKPIYEICPERTGVNATDYMAYYYYAALANCAMHQWEEATLCLEDCLSVPAHAVSAIMVAAYRTHLMVGIISTGRIPSMPRGLSNGNERLLKQICGEYHDLASALEKRNDTQVAKSFQNGGSSFTKDNMMGLVNQACEATRRQAIIALTRTYVTLSLDQIAKEVGSQPAAVEGLLREMIFDGSINAAIDKKSGTVSFTRSTAEVTIAEVEQAIERTTRLSERVAKVDDETIISQPYVMNKLRGMPNLRELLQEYETKKRANRGMGSVLSDIVRSTMN